MTGTRSGSGDGDTVQGWSQTDDERDGAVTQALTPPDPDLAAALALDHRDAGKAAERLPTLIVLVRALFKMATSIQEALTAIRRRLAETVERPDWVGELDTVLDRLERSVGERASGEVMSSVLGDVRAMRGKIDVVVEAVRRVESAKPSGPPPAPSREPVPEVREALQRIEAAVDAVRVAQTAAPAEPRDTEVMDATGPVLKGLRDDIVAVKTTLERVATARQAGPARLYFAMVIGVVILVTAAGVLTVNYLRPTPAGPNTAFVAEVQQLRTSNTVLIGRVNDMLRCTREECLSWHIEGTGAAQKLIRDKCQRVVDPVCLANPAAAPARQPAP